VCVCVCVCVCVRARACVCACGLTRMCLYKRLHVYMRERVSKHVCESKRYSKFNVDATVAMK